MRITPSNYKFAMRLVTKLCQKDPPRGTPDGERLHKLATQIERYELAALNRSLKYRLGKLWTQRDSAMNAARLLKADKARLDWLQLSWNPGSSFFVAPSGAVFRGGGEGRPYRGSRRGYRKDLRTAIDEAMRENARRGHLRPVVRR